MVADVSEGPLTHAVEGMDAVIFAAGAGRHRGPLKQALVDYAGAIRAIVAAQESRLRAPQWPCVGLGRFLLGPYQVLIRNL